MVQVPDVSGMMHTSDFPCLRVSEDVPDTDKRNPDIKARTPQQLPMLHARTGQCCRFTCWYVRSCGTVHCGTLELR